ncbi:SpoIIE family protein phosphatase [Streptomyces sp. NPDC005805]|uniref:SpoIIE family protein phosphatase n=1 Tax=Streptomyces sp. NPDC005805 TaxID=3157068 RepID=UPI0033D54B45
MTGKTSPRPRRTPSAGQSLLGVRTVAGQVLLLQVVVAVVLIAAAVVALLLQASHDGEQEARNRSLAAAAALARSPGMADALAGRDTTGMQAAVGAAAREAGVDFVTITAPDGTRYADTEPELVGSRTDGVERAAGGETFTEIFEGAPSDAARAFVPVTDADGRVVGLVGAGVQIETVGNAVERQLPVLLGSGLAALALATVSAVLVSRRLARQTRGIGPAEMTRMYEHHHAVLHAVREGVVIVDADGRLVLANDEAQRLLRLPPDAVERRVSELGLPPAVTRLLVSDREVSDEVHLVGDRLVSVNTRPTAPYGGNAGNVATLRDTTELRRLSGTAETARERLTILYDAGARIGTTLDVRETAEELSRAVVPRFADFVTVELLDSVLRGDEPSGAVAEMRRAAVSGVREDHPFQPVGDVIRFAAPGTPMQEALADLHAVVVPDLSAASGWRAQDPRGAAAALAYGIHSLVVAPLRSGDAVLGLVAFWRGKGTRPFEGDELSFAEELAARAAVAIDNARRFGREHAMAETLQRSLLPHVMPRQLALDVAYRYLPSHARVGGDWFDVIPLPGARVALVVGDVVGHGLQAAATMGRLRTAVHNFSTLDLPPDELLAHLDELVSRIDQDEPGGGAGDGITGATCLYAVYDPSSGACSMARAGHPSPALVLPDGTVEYLDVPVAPPLGLGGLPVDTAEWVLPEGSRLVLFTDGLVERRGHDIDEGLRTLRRTLASLADRTPEEMCEAVVRAMPDADRRDDVALLVARTARLDPSRVAEWDVPREAASVGPVRGACLRQLQAWGLDEVAFTTELVLSELITNAVRYGSDPVRVRLLYERNLICEVSDGSSTSPHLRRAAATDEGGRGLFLVAQLSDRWGTRYTPTGKVIWAEQGLSGQEAGDGAPGGGPAGAPGAVP